MTSQEAVRYAETCIATEVGHGRSVTLRGMLKIMNWHDFRSDDGLAGTRAIDRALQTMRKDGRIFYAAGEWHKNPSYGGPPR